MGSFRKLGRRVVVVCGLTGLSVVTFSLAVASDRAPQARSVPDRNAASEKQVGHPSRRPLTERPVSVGYVTTEGEVTGLWVTVGTEETGLIKYSLGSASDKSVVRAHDDTSKIDPVNFVQMHGTRKGMAAISNTLAQMLSNEATTIDKIKSPTEGAAKIEGVAFFEEAGAVRLLTVRFERDEPIFEEIGFVAYGCSAALPGASSGCSCNASGTGSSCYGGSEGSTGTYWVKCTDAQGTMTCTGGGGSCNCQGVAAQ